VRNDLLNSERVKQDVELLREHRSNLEQQLQLTEEKYRSLKSDYADLQKRETDLVNQVLKLSQKITDSGEMHSGLFCNHCNVRILNLCNAKLVNFNIRCYFSPLQCK
jgi:predicted nuclease with TOPRIM domain